ncbi:MAG: hypothetical protein CME06_15785 [Gemmatimonadetes bacterium]|nr:hypothetical protein [Gemmatimonadota bacterium]
MLANLASLASVLSVLGSPALAAPPQQPFDLRAARMVDLTHPLNDATLFWPTSPSSFELDVLHHGMTEGGVSVPFDRVERIALTEKAAPFLR